MSSNDEIAVQLFRENLDVAFIVDETEGNLYARTPEDAVIMFTGDFRGLSGERLHSFLVAHFTRGDDA